MATAPARALKGTFVCCRVQRGEDAKAVGTFEGRVRKWRKQWLTAGPTREGRKLLFNVWRPTEERGAPHVRRPNIVPVSRQCCQALLRFSQKRRSQGTWWGM